MFCFLCLYCSVHVSLYLNTRTRMKSGDHMVLGGNTLEHLCMSYGNTLNFSYSSNTLPQCLGTLSERETSLHRGPEL